MKTVMWDGLGTPSDSFCHEHSSKGSDGFLLLITCPNGKQPLEMMMMWLNLQADNFPNLLFECWLLNYHLMKLQPLLPKGESDSNET